MSLLEPGAVFHISTRKHGWISVRLEEELSNGICVVRGICDNKLRTVKRNNLYLPAPTLEPAHSHHSLTKTMEEKKKA